MSRRPVLQNLKVCDFYNKETHRCLADGTSICLDPHLVKEEDCETAREKAKERQGANRLLSSCTAILRESKTKVRR